MSIAQLKVISKNQTISQKRQAKQSERIIKTRGLTQSNHGMNGFWLDKLCTLKIFNKQQLYVQKLKMTEQEDTDKLKQKRQQISTTGTWRRSQEIEDSYFFIGKVMSDGSYLLVKDTPCSTTATKDCTQKILHHHFDIKL